MTTTVVFENATIQDVISKASKIAPTRGGAFDKAAGLVIEIDADTEEVTVRSTNLEVFYMEVCDAVSIEGESTQWIIPSEILASFASKLPIGSGKQVTFKQEGGMLEARTGRTRAKLHLINNPMYPMWEPFDPDGLSPIAKFGDLVEIVEWAAGKGEPAPLDGICIDGEFISATDRFRVARMPMDAKKSIYKQVTIPASITKVLSKHMGDVEVGLGESHLLIMPDDSTQIKATLFGVTHPDLSKFFHATEPDCVKFKRSELIEIIDRAMVMSGRDRTPALRMYLDKERIAVLMIDEHNGQIGDVIDVPGYCQHDRHQIIFSPRLILDALNHSPNEDIEMWYDQTKPTRPVRLEGGSGYQVIIVPRKDLSPIREAGSDNG